MLPLFYLFVTYMVGSLPIGVVVATMNGDVDIRNQGSGNIGATNVTRVLGKQLGLLTLVGDLLKGWICVAAAGLVHPGLWYAGLVALAAFVGHCWSAYLEFRGGKGVATAAGALLAIAPFATLMAAVVWMGAFMAWRISGLAALVAAAALPLLVLTLQPQATWIAVFLCAGVALRHRKNIQTLLRRART